MYKVCNCEPQCVTIVLHYYLKLKVVESISYHDGTLSTDIVYHKCYISVNTKVKPFYYSLYVWLYKNQFNQLREKQLITEILKTTVQLIGQSGL